MKRLLMIAFGVLLVSGSVESMAPSFMGAESSTSTSDLEEVLGLPIKKKPRRERIPVARKKHKKNRKGMGRDIRPHSKLKRIESPPIKKDPPRRKGESIHRNKE